MRFSGVAVSHQKFMSELSELQLFIQSVDSTGLCTSVSVFL